MSEANLQSRKFLAHVEINHWEVYHYMKPFLLNDLHCHSHLSSCCRDESMTPEAILEHAARQGYSAVCLTDHLWDRAIPGASSWYAPQDIDHVCQSLPLPQSESVPFFFGCETELPANNIPALAREHFARFDFVAIPVNHMHMKGLVRPEGVDTPEKMAELVQTRLERLLEQDLPFAKIGLAHLTCSLMFSEGSVADVVRCMSESRLLAIFRGYAQAGAGIELNAQAFAEWEARKEDLLRIYRAAKEAGCKFYGSSDAHSRAALQGVPKVLPQVIAALGLDASHQYSVPQAR